jgi:hypothetical protein
MLKQSLAILFTAGASLTMTQQSSICPMEPRHLTIQLPSNGLVWLKGEDFDGPCDAVSPENWVRAPSKAFDLWTYPVGPEGSGRFWTLTVGLGGHEERNPVRGTCLMTTTAGWRTLQRFNDSPLPWADDLDVDGVPELVVWSSFPLSEEPTQAEFGLVAWVYQVDPARGQFAVDWKLSRKIAGQLAAAYRAPFENDEILQLRRNKAAQALESFSRGTCKVRGGPAR